MGERSRLRPTKADQLTESQGIANDEDVRQRHGTAH